MRKKEVILVSARSARALEKMSKDLQMDIDEVIWLALNDLQDQTMYPDDYEGGTLEDMEADMALGESPSLADLN